MTGLPIPTEDEEHEVLVQWLTLKGLPHHHSVNEMWTTSMRQKRRSKALGQAKGFPDLLVVIPAAKSSTGCGQLIAIELKRMKGGKVTPEQQSWIEMLEGAGVPAQVCFGADGAIRFVECFLRGRKEVRREQ